MLVCRGSLGQCPRSKARWRAQAVALMACRFMNADGNGSREQAIKCMEWCLTKDAHVLSNSWGEVPNSQSLQVRLIRLAPAACVNIGVSTQKLEYI